jgi:isoleucyl-tRNA synthetase
VWLDDAVQTMGSDVIRYLFASASLTEPLKFGEAGARDVKRKFLTLWNVYAMFLTYARLDRPELPGGTAAPPADVTGLERWLLARLQSTVREVDGAFEACEPRRAVTAVEDFIQQDLSNWYVRRRRRLFWKGEMDARKAGAYRTLHHVLVRVAQLLAPVTPFLAEHLYRTLVAERASNAPVSVHLTPFPTVDAALEDPEVEAGVAFVRRVLSVGLAARNAARIKVRQPLGCAVVHTESTLAPWLRAFDDDLRDELNVEVVTLAPAADLPDERFVRASEGGITVALDTTLTPALRRKGLVRQLVHQVQMLRKSARLDVDDRIRLFVATDDDVRAAVEEHRGYVMAETLAMELVFATPPPGVTAQTVSLQDGRAIVGVCAWR